jgi:lipopolysaccharide export LptBFGC system permease protein LptF
MALAVAIFFTGITVAAQDKAAADLEAEFTAMLKNATLKGSWIPVGQGAVGKEKADGYRIVRAEKVKGDTWHIVYKVKVRGQEIEYPFPVIIKWAGDTPVMIIDNIRSASGSRYSARVMFHNDRYAGSWWGKNEPGGLLSGVVTRKKAE